MLNELGQPKKSNTEFESELFKHYSTLPIPNRYEHISTIDKHIQWYLADDNDVLINAKTSDRMLLDIDISKAFPSLCNILYSDGPFIDKMNSIENKREKNIFIATTLKGEPLRLFNILCKMTIMSYIFDVNSSDELNDLELFELKKDGCLISCSQLTYERIKNISSSTNPISVFLNKYFNIHTTIFLNYIRVNATSFFITESFQLIVKGRYKYLPDYIKTIITRIFINDISQQELNGLLSIYNLDFLKLCSITNTMSLIKKYFECSNGKIITTTLDYKSIMNYSEISPRLYLKLFVFPILYSKC